ncbi:DUF2637 domain-containing protein [Micromonospora sp. NPDC005174]|uniref:DUF2637 domain-containing protein n=1 Tax=Micromonospora sp. NPDC005174 TaxID=3157018 RepID=UPI0033A960DB
MIANAATFIPDPGESVSTTVPSTPAPEANGWLGHITAWTDTIPSSTWAITLAALTLFTLVSLPWARAQSYKAGQRASGSNTTRKGTALFVAAMVPAAFFWLAVLAGSFRGLAGFGTDTLKWKDGWEYLVPLTLDGIAISFGFLAFRAVSASRSPERANRVVMATAAASALINYGHEVSNGGSKLGGGYLALLSVLGMLIFHEFLDQFTEGTAYIQRVNPKFGLRWITWPSNTVCAWIAWRNYPPTPLAANPSDGQKRWWGSVNHAVAHLNTVRRAKRVAQFDTDRQTRLVDAPAWLVKVPAVRKLTATLTVHRAETAEMAARLDKVAADFAAEQTRAEAAVQRAEDQARNAARALSEKATADGRAADALRQAEKARTDAAATVHRTESIADRRVTAAQAELAHTAARLDRMEQQWIAAKQEAAVLAGKLADAQSDAHTARLSADRAEKTAAALRSALTDAAEKHTAELADTTNRLRAQMAENEARIRAEVSTVNLTEYRTGERRKSAAGQRSKAAEKNTAPSNAARMSDDEAVQALFSADMNPGRVWKQDEVRSVTGAGFGRIPRLLAALAEFHRTDEAERLRSAARRSTAESAEMPAENASGEGAEIARSVAHAG